MDGAGREERGADNELTRGERREERQEAERQRMPKHGKGLGVMVRNALQRRPAAAEPRRPPR